MSSQISKNHHYIPRFYLRRFTDGGKLWDSWRSPRGELQEKPRGIENVGSEEYLYTLGKQTDWDTTTPEDTVEKKYLKPLDSAAADALNTLICRPSALASNDTLAWARFVNSLLSRSPQRLGERRVELNSVHQETLQSMYARASDDDASKRLRALLATFDLDAVKQHVNLHSMVKETDHAPTLEYLSAFQHVVMNLDCGIKLPTGDAPVVINLGKGGPLRYYTMSLSPKHLLLACPQQDEPIDLEFAKLLPMAHCCALISQVTHLYSQERLEDGPFRMRLAAATQLPEQEWRKS